MNVLVVGILTGIIRNIAGWWESAAKDKKITTYEWAELGVTILRVSLLAVSAHYALGLEDFAAAGSALLLDYFYKAFKK